MAEIIDLQAFRAQHNTAFQSSSITMSKIGVKNIDGLTCKVETMLESAAQNDRFAHTVALAAGRYAAMQLFQLHGHAQTLSFFEDCIQTVELCDDLLKQMDDEF